MHALEPLTWSSPRTKTPPSPSQMVTVPHGVLTAFQVKKVDERRRVVSGAVYQDGKLLPMSQRIGGRGGDLVKSEDPETIVGTAGYSRLSGRWLYAGNWMGQFGHFITETLTNMWPREFFDGIVCHPFVFGNSIDPWQIELVRRLGHSVPILISNQGCVVDELVIPQRPFILNDSVEAQAANVWQRVASAGSLSRKVFLSRSKLSNDSRRVDGDERLDQLMESLGFDVVHPETLPIGEQLDLVAQAGILSGVSGSALHLSVFANSHAKILEIGDTRSHSQALPNQRLIDDSVGRTSGFVPYIATESGRDLPETERMISSLVLDGASRELLL